MNPTQSLNKTMRDVEARDTALLMQQEDEEEAWLTACDQAEGEICFDDLIDALVDLSESEKSAALIDAARYCPTDLLAQTFERLVRVKARQCLQQDDDQDFGGDAA